jgi:peptidoglycan-associated lipoprotein
MKNNILAALLLVSMVTSCASKKKQDDNALNQPAQVTNESIELDSMGSDSGKIAGLYTIYFDFDKSHLTNEAKSLLKKNAEWLKNNPGVRLQVEGHCDVRGSIEYNLGLGERRAKAAVQYLKSLGVAGDRLSVISYGKERPIAMGDSEADHAKNRRANFVPLK